ncbi:MAG: helix-turn-helix transcriptional regulator [Deltaproteobacteria bacterium]|nr:MAG: helix-turn-helix transcriptional regulator [Deltaproteobacteria bacterium]
MRERSLVRAEHDLPVLVTVAASTPSARGRPRRRRALASPHRLTELVGRRVPCDARSMSAGETPYTEIAPPADLAPYVDRLWLRTTMRSGGTHRVLPDGCVDILIHADRAAAELVGTMTCALEIPEEPAELVAVRFRPGTATAITGCALAELTDRSVDLADLGIAGELADRVVDAGARPDPGLLRLSAKLPLSASAHARLSALIAWLRQRLTDAEPPDPLVVRAVSLLSAGDARVDDVTDAVGVSRQYLARAFRREVGITPKQLARIARMQRAAAVLRRGADLARLAAELGYFDQSHLSHELRELAGITPAAVAAERPIALSHLFGTAL